MSKYFYTAEITTETPIPDDLIKEAVVNAVRKLVYNYEQRQGVKASVRAAGGTLSSDEIKLTKVPEEKVRVTADDLDDDLWAAVEWAGRKMLEEREKAKAEEAKAVAAQEEAEKAYHPGGFYGAWDAAGYAVAGLPGDVYLDLATQLDKRAAKFTIEVPREVAEAIGFRPIDNISINGQDVAALLADKHFQEPVTQPGRKHPFDGPEVFDDKVGNIRPIDKSLPRLNEVISSKREEPKAEGDWQLEGGDRVGEDTD